MQIGQYKQILEGKDREINDWKQRYSEILKKIEILE